MQKRPRPNKETNRWNKLINMSDPLFPLFSQSSFISVITHIFLCTQISHFPSIQASPFFLPTYRPLYLRLATHVYKATSLYTRCAWPMVPPSIWEAHLLDNSQLETGPYSSIVSCKQNVSQCFLPNQNIIPLLLFFCRRENVYRLWAKGIMTLKSWFDLSMLCFVG